MSEYFSLMCLSTGTRPLSFISTSIVKRSACSSISGKYLSRDLSSPFRRPSIATPSLSKMADLMTGINPGPTVSFAHQITRCFQSHALSSLESSLIWVCWTFSQVYIWSPEVDRLKSAKFQTYQVISELPHGFYFRRLSVITSKVTPCICLLLGSLSYSWEMTCMCPHPWSRSV